MKQSFDEYALIRQFAGAFSRSPRQRNALFESDAELIMIGDELWGLTLDEFTPEEDLFSAEDPLTLGMNLATATLSDLLASGIVPELFMHSVALPATISPEFVNELASGIREILDEAACSVCGGDVGSADAWRFCGFAMGRAPGNRSVMRIIPPTPQQLWVTGQLGDANLAALTDSATPLFECRLSEAKLIRQWASACIDTSGGFLEAAWMLHILNPATAFTVNIDDLPICPGVAEFAAAAHIPAGAALVGGAGEYEFLIAFPEDLPRDAVDQLADAGMSPIGCTAPAQGGNLLLKHGSLCVPVSTPPPCPRAAGDIPTHVNEVIAYSRQLFAFEDTSS